MNRLCCESGFPSQMRLLRHMRLLLDNLAMRHEVHAQQVGKNGHGHVHIVMRMTSLKVGPYLYRRIDAEVNWQHALDTDHQVSSCRLQVSTSIIELLIVRDFGIKLLHGAVPSRGCYPSLVHSKSANAAL